MLTRPHPAGHPPGGPRRAGPVRWAL